MLKISNLSKQYGKIKALDNVSFSVEKGNIYGILGPNGSGKTTTLAILLGIVFPDSGTFVWDNYPPNQPVNLHVGALLESPNFYPYLTIEQNMKIATHIKKITTNNEKEIDRTLDIAKLRERKKSKYKHLSFGMKQRLSLASLLLGDPDILILDEPTNGLDPQGIADVRQIIVEQGQNGKTILLASHILDEVEKVCSHVAVLKKGQLLAQGKVNELLGATEAIVLIAADDNKALHEIMARSEMVKTIQLNDKEIALSLEKGYKPADINKFAFQNNIILSKFEVKEKSLEDQFLELVK